MQMQDFAYLSASKRTPLWYRLAMVLFAGIFLFSAMMLGERLLGDTQAENEFACLQALITVDAPPAQSAADSNASQQESKFAQLYEKNPDFVGWLSISDTTLSYPVMQRPQEKDYYLRHSFEGEYSIYGVPYLDEECTLQPQSTNLIVYGHNMKTGIIFGCLTNYKEKSYYTQHPVITFDTLYGSAEYEVFAAFAIDVTQDNTFAYNGFITAQSEKQFNAFVEQCLRRSDVNSGITPVYGDSLLTLSTCEYSTSDGRYVVVARKRNAD